MAWTLLAVFVLFVLPVTAIGTLLMFIRGARDWKTWCSSTGMIIAVYLAGVATAYMMTKDSNSARQAKAKPVEVPPVVASNPTAKATEPQSPNQAQPETKPAAPSAPPQSTPATPSTPAQSQPAEQPTSKPTVPTADPSASNPTNPVSSPAPTQPPATQPQPPTTQPPIIPPTPSTPNPTPSQPLTPAKGPNGETIKGSTNAQGEKVYYLPSSASFEKAAAERWFASEDDAKKAGYKLAS